MNKYINNIIRYNPYAIRKNTKKKTFEKFLTKYNLNTESRKDLLKEFNKLDNATKMNNKILQFITQKNKANAEAKAKAKTNANAEAKAKAKANANAEAKAKANAEAKAKAKTNANAEAKAKAKANANAEAKAKANAEAKAKAKAKANAEAKAKANAQKQAAEQAQKQAEQRATERIKAVENEIINQTQELKKKSREFFKKSSEFFKNNSNKAADEIKRLRDIRNAKKNLVKKYKEIYKHKEIRQNTSFIKKIDENISLNNVYIETDFFNIYLVEVDVEAEKNNMFVIKKFKETNEYNRSNVVMYKNIEKYPKPFVKIKMLNSIEDINPIFIMEYMHVFNNYSDIWILDINLRKNIAIQIIKLQLELLDNTLYYTDLKIQNIGFKIKDNKIVDTKFIDIGGLHKLFSNNNLNIPSHIALQLETQELNDYIEEYILLFFIEDLLNISLVTEFLEENNFEFYLDSRLRLKNNLNRIQNYLNSKIKTDLNNTSIDLPNTLSYNIDTIQFLNIGTKKYIFHSRNYLNIPDDKILLNVIYNIYNNLKIEVSKINITNSTPYIEIPEVSFGTIHHQKRYYNLQIKLLYIKDINGQNDIFIYFNNNKFLSTNNTQNSEQNRRMFKLSQIISTRSQKNDAELYILKLYNGNVINSFKDSINDHNGHYVNYELSIIKNVSFQNTNDFENFISFIYRYAKSN